MLFYKKPDTTPIPPTLSDERQSEIIRIFTIKKKRFWIMSILSMAWGFGLIGLGKILNVNNFNPPLWVNIGLLIMMSLMFITVIYGAFIYRCPHCDKTPTIKSTFSLGLNFLTFNRFMIALNPEFCSECGVRLKPVTHISDSVMRGKQNPKD